MTLHNCSDGFGPRASGAAPASACRRSAAQCPAGERDGNSVTTSASPLVSVVQAHQARRATFSRPRPNHEDRTHVGLHRKRRTAASGQERCRSYIRGTCGSVSRIRSARGASAAPQGRSSSIWDGRHRPSRAAYLRRAPTIVGTSAGPSVPTTVGTRRNLAFHPVGFAWPVPSPRPPVRSYRTLSPLTPTGPKRSSGIGAGLLSVARAVDTAPAAGASPAVVGSDAAFPLGSTVPCGVRTFLTADADKCRPRRSDDPTRTSLLCTPERPAKFEGARHRKGAAAEAAICAHQRLTFSFISSTVSL